MHDRPQRRPAAGAGRRLVAPGGGEPATAGGEDFLSGASGTVGGPARRPPARARPLARRPRGARGRARLRARRRGATPPRRRVVVARRRPPRRPRPARRRPRPSCAARRHDVDVRTAPAPGRAGSSRTSTRCWPASPAAGHDWLLVIDDDVALPRGFLDRFLLLAERFGLRLAQPAHRLHSHAAWSVTRRRPRQRGARDGLRRDRPGHRVPRATTFDALLPFPTLRMGWGLDVHWAALARERGLAARRRRRRRRSATRSRPAADAYPREAAIAEARAFLAGRALRARATRSAHAGRAPPGEARAVKVVVVAEFYPRARDPVLGVVGPPAGASPPATPAPRCACSSCTAPSPARAPRRASALRDARRLRAPSRGTRRSTASRSRYVPFLAPPRPGAATGRGARGRRRRSRVALRSLRRRFAFDLVHAHNAVPAADAVLRAGSAAPLVVSEHGADVFHTAPRHAAGLRGDAARLRRRPARPGQQRRDRAACRALGARPGPASSTSAPTSAEPADARRGRAADARHRRAPRRPQAPRRRPARAALLRDRHPSLRWVVVGDGPERAALGRLARELGVADRVELAGQLDRRRRGAARGAPATLFVMPSVDEAFGVAYVEAMAAGVPAVGCARRAGAGGARRRGRRHPARAPARPRGARRRAGRPAHRRLRAARRSAAPRAPPSRRTSRGQRSARATVAAYEDALRAGPHERPRPPGPRRDEPRAARPRWGLRRAARAGGHRARPLRRPLAPRDRGAAGPRRPAPPGAAARRPGRSPPAGATARSSPGRPGASPSRPPGAAPAAPARRFCCGARCGRAVRTPAHVLGAPLLRAIVRDADVVVTYGPHVSRHALAQGARAVVVAPQAVDAAFWSTPGDPRRARFGDPQVAFAGREVPEKGGAVLRAAWRVSGLGARGGALVRIGAGGPGPRRASRARWRSAPSRRRSCATSSRPPTSSWCPRWRRAPSASRGGWWSTRPCIKARPS